MTVQTNSEEVHHEPSFSYSGSELDALAGAENYYRMLIRRFGPHLGKRVLEVGAGVGTFAHHLLDRAGGIELTVVEPADNNYPLLRERFSGIPNVTSLHGYLEDLDIEAKFDSIVAVNVLEHVQTDEKFLSEAYRRLAPDGSVLLYVRPLPGIFGSLGDSFDHYRRYTRPTLSDRLTRAGFQIVELRYSNLARAFAWFILGRIMRRQTIRPFQVQIYDRWMVPWIDKVEGYASPPFGQSLWVIAKRPR